MQNLLEIGQIVNSYGIKGFLKVVPFTDNVNRFNNLKNIYIEKNKKLEEVEIDKNSYIKIDRKDAVKLPENSYFIVDLMEMEVYTDDGKMLRKDNRCISNGKQ